MPSTRQQLRQQQGEHAENNQQADDASNHDGNHDEQGTTPPPPPAPKTLADIGTASESIDSAPPPPPLSASSSSSSEDDLDRYEDIEKALEAEELARQQEIINLQNELQSYKDRVQTLESPATASAPAPSKDRAETSATAPAINGNSQPPLCPPAPSQPSVAAIAEMVAQLLAQGTTSDRRRPLDDTTCDRPAQRQRTSSTATSNTQPAVSIPGLSREGSAAALALMKQAGHPAFGLPADEVAKLRLKARPSGPEPNHKLDVTDVDKYASWAHALQLRWVRDWIVYLTDDEKISYALTWLEGSLFESLNGWWTDPTVEDKSYAAFLFELETTLGVHFQHSDARRELELARQEDNELVNAYYTRLRTLWHRANTPELDRIEKLRSSVHEDLSTLSSHVSLKPRRSASLHWYLSSVTFAPDRST